jgi:hypothetical protein
MSGCDHFAASQSYCNVYSGKPESNARTKMEAGTVETGPAFFVTTFFIGTFFISTSNLKSLSRILDRLAI